MEISGGEISVPYSLFKGIESAALEKTATTKYLISNASYSCVCKDSFVSVECEFQIRVFESSNNTKKTSSTTPSSNKESIQLVSQKATILNSTIQYSKGSTTTNGTEIGASILTSGQFYYLYTGAAGRYNVKLELSVPYLTDKEAGMDLSIPQCSNNSVFFRVSHVNANIKIFNSFLDIQSMNDWSSKHSKDSNTYTVIFVKLANETQLKAQWTINEDFSNKFQIGLGGDVNNNNNNNTVVVPKVTVKPNVIVSQSNLCSIGEGLLLLKCQFDYKIIAGTLSSFNIEIQDNINIINVEGVALKRWEVLDLEKPESPKHNRVIQIQLDYGFDNHYSIYISGEYSMRDTSGQLNIPSMICKGEEISRQRGFLGVEARTNVEISDIGNAGLNVVDVRELPTELSRMANHPILLSYKFLEPDFQLQLVVKRNMDCAVLVSICEEAHFVTTVSYSGKMIHQMILSIKNTQQQFLRVQVPFEYEIWSTMMDGEPIRPSICESHLLVPILKPGVFDQNTPIKIEIVLLQKSIHTFNQATKKGRFNFIVPKIDLALRAAFSTIYLPNGYQAYNFTGNLKQVSYFSSTPPSASNPNSAAPVTRAGGRGGWKNRNDSICMEMDNANSFPKMKMASSMMSKKEHSPNSRRGVVPVFVEIPQTQNPYYFQQILLSGDKDLTYNFDYHFTETNIRR